jgi:hypothetical protein
MESTNSIWKSDGMTSLDWDVLKAAGLPLVARTKFAPDAQGTFIVNGWNLYLRPSGIVRGSRHYGYFHRLVVNCDCGAQINAGHYGQHFRSKRHAQAESVAKNCD